MFTPSMLPFALITKCKFPTIFSGLPGWPDPHVQPLFQVILFPSLFSVMPIFQFLEPAKFFTASGPLHMMCSCTSLYLYRFTLILPFWLLQVTSLYVTFSEKPSLTTMSEVSPFFYLMNFLSLVFDCLSFTQFLYLSLSLLPPYVHYSP